jgi:hypothetical protein
MPNVVVQAHHKRFKSAILICPDRQVIFRSNLRWWASETLPLAPKWCYVNLPGMPKVAIVAEGEHFDFSVERSSDIERCLEPSNSNCRVWLWLRVPALMPPGVAVRRLLPSIAKCSIAGRKDLKVAVCILLH